VWLATASHRRFFCALLGAPDPLLGARIERDKAFLDAGADCVFAPGVRDAATIGALGGRDSER